jgi:hypothetical protein
VGRHGKRFARLAGGFLAIGGLGVLSGLI